ncbi:putative DEAD/DEAH box helicase [Sodiomyces alkalinus F11]|uniref:ATP-dependent RNA helicase n=1 Tax=Sodiomyces alkalinus (strain CBS 110278 / VKM F-3762 / F11) TaxID=1314773 RepID=A0A3N2Q6W5_SODAK|nr:putative DEAD/DEAH box helicase [Sodiomyces alkalinus F11]ROT42427.1 putative DEAD/DEAH box helicase [Sodiomyces alkalinus F11]
MAPAEKKKDPRDWRGLTPPLAEWILDFVSSQGFQRMTPVQAACVPQFLGNKDVVVEAVTGSGKTLAFLLPLVQKLVRLEEPIKRGHVFAIIVSPTRELAVQIHSVLSSLVAFHGPSAEMTPYLKDDDSKRPDSTVPVIVPQLLVGGTTTTQQDLSFFVRHAPNVLVSTPGRLVELLAAPQVRCPHNTFEMLILDEADRILDMGFRQDLQKILSRLPKQRRTGLFSASVSEAVSQIITVGLRNPVKIAVRVKSLRDGNVIEDRKIPASLQMSYLVIPASQKLPALAQLVEKLQPRPQRSIVFLSTCAAVDYFQHVLPSLLPSGYNLVPLHGKLPAKAREKSFARFVNAVSPSILLCTDLAARGLDIPQVDLVCQVDPPSDPKVFIHRAGRAGRAGRKGLAVVFLHPGREEDYVPFLEIRKTPIEPLPKPHVSVTAEDAEAATATIRSILRSDRAYHDKAQRAFVSWVRSYAAHQTSSIFRIQDLDWADLGRAWGLLRLPTMPELRSWDGDRTLGLGETDWDAFAYKDKVREKARLEALDAERNGTAAAAAADGKEDEERKKRKRRNTEAWSDKHERAELRTVRREKRHKRREKEREQNMTEEEKVKSMELKELIEEVRRRNQTENEDKKEDEFDGF